MQIANRVSTNGFVVGWEPAQLGNALTCLANLFVLSQKTAIPAVFYHMRYYSHLFERGTALSVIDPQNKMNRLQLDLLLGALDEIVSTFLSSRAVGDGVFELRDVTRAEVSGVVWLCYSEMEIKDWRLDDAELKVQEFCARGNGLILTRAFWWQYTDMRELATYGILLREHLGTLLQQDVPARAASMLDEPDALKIGVHIRRGDYKIWRDGQYFYDLSQYRAIADRVHAELGPRCHRFYIFSDEGIDDQLFAGLPVFTHQGPYFADFVGLSACDYVIGPPSSFATWAAFLGKKKRIVLTSKEISSTLPLLEKAVDIIFPTGAYLPGDEKAGPL